jgi:3-oxoacyl-[acyl-carrier protein] reductase
MNAPIPEYPSSHGLLRDKTVLITAAAGTGIGFATAKRCAEEGAAVFLSDVHARRLDDAASRLREEVSTPVFAHPCDVTRQEDVEALVKRATSELGHIDVLVNNAGLGGYSPVREMTDEAWNKVIDVSLTGTFRMTRAVLGPMMDRGAGVIINNASVLAWRAQEGQAHYAAAKAGVLALTRCSALEAAKCGVRINAVAPSIASHPFLEKVASKELLDGLAKREAFGRAAACWEVANVIVFLASSYSSYLTGEVISVSSQRA